VNGYKIGRSEVRCTALSSAAVLPLVSVKIMFGLRAARRGLRLSGSCGGAYSRRSVLTRSSGVICVELMKKVQDHGYRIAQVPVHHFHRSYGKSQFFNYPARGPRRCSIWRGSGWSWPCARTI